MIFQARTWNAVTSSRRASKKGETPCPVMPDTAQNSMPDNLQTDMTENCDFGNYFALFLVR
jgi:hypothetical protein